MICPNCKHELNPQARVCPTCGTPVSGAPTVVIAPPPQAQEPPEKRGVTGPRVFVIIFCLLAAVANGLMAWSWFLPAIRVTAKNGVVKLYSMYQICYDIAPYMTYILCALCAISFIFCLLPLLPYYANRRSRLFIPKLMCVLSAVCYALPYWAASIAHNVNVLINGGTVSHSNPFTTLCLVLFILLCLASEFTIWNRRLVHEHRIEDLEQQLRSHGIPPVE